MFVMLRCRQPLQDVADLSFTAFQSTITSPALAAVAHHWLEARGNKPMPSWKEISPSRIARQLSIVWFYDYDQTSDSFTGRLAGIRIEQKFGHRFKGLSMQSLYEPVAYQLLFARYKRVVWEPKLYKGEGGSLIHEDRAGPGERIILPLAGDHVHADGIMGATDYRTSALPAMEEGFEHDRWYSL